MSMQERANAMALEKRVTALEKELDDLKREMLRLNEAELDPEGQWPVALVKTVKAAKRG